jgi:ABC-type sugar transport system ATPase subunit
VSLDLSQAGGGGIPSAAYVPASYETFDLTKSFPGVVAVDHVSLAVYAGEIHGIIGKNGAGKTVLMSTLAGIYSPSAGRFSVGGTEVDVSHYSPRQARSLGIALIPQEPLFARDQTVVENLFMGGIPQRGFLIDFRGARQAVVELCDRLGLSVKPDQPVGEVSIEDQQMLALGRALFLDRARVILLDEITASLSRQRKQVLKDAMRGALADRPDVSFTLITHHIDEILEFCDRVTVMRDGQAVRTLDVPRVSKAVLASWIVGTEESGVLPSRVGSGEGYSSDKAPAGGEPTPEPADEAGVVLEVSSLGLEDEVEGLSFELRIGEVLGIAGLDGSGKDTVFAILAGIRQPDRGDIRVNGRLARLRTPLDARRAGIAYLPKKRDQYAVLTGRSVQENLLCLVYPQLASRFGLINELRARSRVRATMQTVHIVTPSMATPIDSLSGGNRQKVILGRILQSTPFVYLLNEPTRGVDLATKPDLLATIRSQLASRAGVLLTSESEDELIEICDRVLVLYHGQSIAEVRRGSTLFTSSELYRLVQGVSAGVAA